MTKINDKNPKITLANADLFFLADSEDLSGVNPTIKKLTYQNLLNAISSNININDVNDVVTFKGYWNAETNTPTLSDGGEHNTGDLYIVDTQGILNLGYGDIDFYINDFVIYDGSKWVKYMDENTMYSILASLIPYFRYSYALDEDNIPLVDEEGNFIIDVDNVAMEETLSSINENIVGGTTGQYLVKNSDDDYDYSWGTLTISLTLDDILDGTEYVRSHNDFSDTYKNKLDNIASGAEVNVQADWTETNTGLDSYILNKPINTNTTNIPIEFPEDGRAPPATAELYENNNKKVRIRKFSNSANNDVTFDWTTPHDMDTSQPIQFRVKGIVTEVYGSGGSNVKFDLSGYASEDGELIGSPSYVPPQSVTKTVSVTQHNAFVTEWSSDITIGGGVTQDTINQFTFNRDVSVASNYEYDIAIIEIEIKYTKR